MATVERPTGVRTHEVANQPEPLVDYNVFEADRPLVEAVRLGADWAEERISGIGQLAGSGRAIELGSPGQRNPPNCVPTTATATASTWSSTTPPITA